MAVDDFYPLQRPLSSAMPEAMAADLEKALEHMRLQLLAAKAMKCPALAIPTEELEVILAAAGGYEQAREQAARIAEMTEDYGADAGDMIADKIRAMEPVGEPSQSR